MDWKDAFVLANPVFTEQVGVVVAVSVDHAGFNFRDLVWQICVFCGFIVLRPYVYLILSLLIVFVRRFFIDLEGLLTHATGRSQLRSTELDGFLQGFELLVLVPLGVHGSVGSRGYGKKCSVASYCLNEHFNNY